jgi:hypothetical protein
MPVYGGRRTREGRPRAWRTPVEGGTDPRVRRNLLEGERALSEAEPARGKHTPSNGAEPAQGGRASSSEAEPARGDLQEGRLGGPSGSLRHGPYPAWLGTLCFGFVVGFKWGFPRCLRGPLGLSPTS